ncbi:hypothetical protein NDU88_000923 [Pleurodeles waltl]|uniref:Reverse transcriptase domain-containing protein n=1 Tax=Pleurodeles waltl TaxID=8319 RepID=A0AAV7N9C8_PLEWA|nr:hypothetical protein NDU88_000923 [Pleurodeles waltl]
MWEGLIVMILKPSAASSDPASHRPITMINLDLKFLCKILATRLGPEVTRLIHPDQCRFIPGRNKTMNIRRLMHVLHGAEDREDDLALVSVDIVRRLIPSIGITF